jgi:hypothetical protein
MIGATFIAVAICRESFMRRYHRLLIAAGAVLVLAAQGRSDEIYVLDNQPSLGTSNGMPFHTVSIASQENRFQMYIGAQHLPARACTFTHVSFAPCESSVFSAATFEIRMSHTTLKQPLGTFANNLPSPIAVVPAQSIVWQRTKDQWSAIKFVNPFHYNGTDHLMIEVRLKGATPGSRMDHTAAFIAPGLYRVYTLGTNAYNAPLGIRLHSAFVTIKPGAPFNIGTISNTYVFTIMK